LSGRILATEVRVLLCRQCGAPYRVPEAGGYLTCEHCDATIEVSRRPKHSTRLLDPSLDPDLDPEQRERVRMESLRAQEEAYEAETNPYAYIHAPARLEHLDPDQLDPHSPDAPGLVLEELQQAWERCRESRRSMTHQRQVYWLTRKLAVLWGIQRDPLRVRGAVETSLELLTDPGYQHLLHCKMSGLALRADDAEAARAWLERCDPRPEVLDLDTGYRTSLAMLHAHLGDWAQALGLIGAERGEIPYEPSHLAVINGLRAAALESLGRPDAAESELLWLLNQPFPGEAFLEAMFAESKVWAPCRAIRARLRDRFPSGEGRPG